MCAGARATAGVLLVSTLCVCVFWGQDYGWSIATEFCVCVYVCVCVLGLEYC